MSTEETNIVAGRSADYTLGRVEHRLQALVDAVRNGVGVDQAMAGAEELLAELRGS
ncbi:MAG: hypothetical protein ACR2G7_11045 [Acidimicrobiales bacterium]